MNPASSSSLWVSAIVLLAVEVALIIAVASALDHRCFSSFWRRSFWQTALVSLFVVMVFELSGLGRALMAWTAPRPASISADQMSSSVFVQGVDPMNLTGEENRVAAAVLPSDFSTPRPLEPVITTLAGVWMSGVIGLLAWFGLGRWRLRRWRRQSRAITDQALLRLIRSLCDQWNLHGRLRIWESPGLAGPVAFGLIHPQLALPVGFATDFSLEEQEVMLAHELAHLTGRDPIWYVLADLSVTLLWWHPLAWWARRRFHFASECVADEASALLEDGPERLAECLVKMGRRLSRPTASWRLEMVGSGFRSALGRRVQRLLEMQPAQKRPVADRPLWVSFRIAGPIALSLAVFGGTWWAQPATSAPPNFRQAWHSSPVGLLFAQLAPAAGNDPPAASPASAAGAPATPPGQSLPTAPAKAEVDKAPGTERPLKTTWFRVDPNTLLTRLRKMAVLPGTQEPVPGTNDTAVILEAMRGAFDGVGVSLEPPRRIYFNDRVGLLMVRVPEEEMKFVENLIGMLTDTPPQVTIEVEMIKMSRDQAEQLQADWRRLWPNVVMQQPKTTGAERGKQIQWKALLTNPQFQSARRTLSQRRDTERVLFPKITTLSDRQAQLSSGREAQARTNLVIDLVPIVRSDGYTIDLTAIVVTPDVLGFELESEKKTFDTIDPNVSWPPIGAPTLEPVYARAIANGRVWDGQTMVVATAAEKDRPSATDPRVWLFFITPTVIDPAGNRVFNEDELRFAQEWVPPQH